MADGYRGYESPTTGDEGAGMFFKKCQCEDESEAVLLAVYSQNDRDHRGCGREGNSIGSLIDRYVLEWMRDIVRVHRPPYPLRPRPKPYPPRPSYHSVSKKSKKSKKSSHKTSSSDEILDDEL